MSVGEVHGLVDPKKGIRADSWHGSTPSPKNAISAVTLPNATASAASIQQQATNHLFATHINYSICATFYWKDTFYKMGALLSLPLLVLPSAGTVWRFPGAFIRVAQTDLSSYLPSAPHVVEQRHAQRYAAHVGSSRTGAFEGIHLADLLQLMRS